LLRSPSQATELNALARRNSRRTGHDTLASSGSHCSAAAIEQAPVGEQPCLAARNALQPVDGPRPVPVQGLELPTGPSRQDDIDVPQGRVERRRVEPTIVVDPAPDVRVEHPRQIVQRLVTALLKGPAAHGLTDRLESFVADGRTERDADLPSPSARQPRPESIAEEVELLVGIVATSVIILAIDDFRLLRMEFQSAALQSCSDGLPQ
jgi:hypothetical protein